MSEPEGQLYKLVITATGIVGQGTGPPVENPEVTLTGETIIEGEE